MSKDRILTPKKNDEHALGISLTRPVEGGWCHLGGVLLLHNPAVNPGNDVEYNNVVETGALLEFDSYADVIDSLTCK